ncbi:hypothetical protein GZH47_33545 (plasmid) [Paenibacillus rhizovicinus]|uniref:Uncharacterized protein n=1 Tax=Paenibacillus rhizovicinus TaxID=2704463 RepID=A0A6C0PBJ3_9BACL|nr:hypothetical protein [Paenibacillus rhizovicinus]QHW35819.1 hypothetical protein GZH47_33545 [Paenibacillus rhizovicinus]
MMHPAGKILVTLGRVAAAEAGRQLVKHGVPALQKATALAYRKYQSIKK